jgi:P27 family predicted phage terminase small subunit
MVLSTIFDDTVMGPVSVGASLTPSDLTLSLISGQKGLQWYAIQPTNLWIENKMTKKAVFASDIKPPRCPTWLPTDAKRTWKKIVNSNPPDWFRDSDLPLLESYCLSYSQMRDAHTVLETEGIYTSNAAGSVIAHPAMKIISDCQSRLSMLATKMRLCQNARHTDTVATTAKKNRTLGTTSSSGSNVRKMFNG